MNKVLLNMKNIILSLFIVVNCTAWSQQIEDTLSAQIDLFFNALETGDSALMRNIIHENIILTTTYAHPKTGQKVYRTEAKSDFLQAIGTPHTEKWEERVSNVEVKIDDNLAIAWMNYSFFVDDKFSHCGVNLFEFVKLDNIWVITHIIDTRRKNNCNESLSPN